MLAYVIFWRGEMRLFLLVFVFFSYSCLAIEPVYIKQGRELLVRWGVVYRINKYSLGEIYSNDVSESLGLFEYSDVVNSYIYSNVSRDAIYKYIDGNIKFFGNLSGGGRLNLIGCLELSNSDGFNALIKKQDNFLYQSNAGIGAVIRTRGQICPFAGKWRMLTRYDTYKAHEFKKGDVFPKWKNSDGISGYEWVLESRRDGGNVKLKKTLFLIHN